MNLNVVVLADEKSLGMNSKDFRSFSILGKPLLKYALDVLKPLKANETLLVSDDKEILSAVDNDIKVVSTQEVLDILKDKDGQTLLLLANMPLLKSETLLSLINEHSNKKSVLTLLNHDFESGCVIDNKLFFSYLNKVKGLSNSSLLDLIDKFSDDNPLVNVNTFKDPNEGLKVNNRCDLAFASKLIKSKINEGLMLSGITLEDPDTTYISPDIKIGKDTIIRANTHILGNSFIGENNVIGPNSYLENTTIGNNNKVISSYLTDVTVGNNNELGPYLKARTNTQITDNCRVGNFVELKNAILKPGVKCAHLSYLGDSEVGERTNIGCMTVTANYDGYNKSRTTIGKDVFIGSGTILVAPITVEDEGFTAAGSTITKPVLSDELAVERAQQVNIKGGSSKVKGKAKAKKEAMEKC